MDMIQETKKHTQEESTNKGGLVGYAEKILELSKQRSTLNGVDTIDVNGMKLDADMVRMTINTEIKKTIAFISDGIEEKKYNVSLRL